MVFADGTSYIKLQFALNASALYLTWSSTLKQSEGSQFIVETQQDTSRYNIFRLSKNAASHHAVQLSLLRSVHHFGPGCFHGFSFGWFFLHGKQSP